MKRSGLTLLEVVITTGLAVGILLILTRFVGMVSQTEKFLNTRLQSVQDVSQAITAIVTEIRSMGPSGNGAYPIESASTGTLVFFSDGDRDGVFERIRYTLGTSTLTKGVVKPTGVPLVYATSSEIVTTALPNLIRASSSFAYFNSSYTGSGAAMTSTVDVTPIRVVQLTLTADVSTSSAPKPVVFTNVITIRNLKSN